MLTEKELKLKVRYNAGENKMEEEHIVQECICLKCFYRWIDVRPVGTRLKDLECPACHQIWYVIGTGEPIDED